MLEPYSSFESKIDKDWLPKTPAPPWSGFNRPSRRKADSPSDRAAKLKRIAKRRKKKGYA